MFRIVLVFAVLSGLTAVAIAQSDDNPTGLTFQVQIAPNLVGDIPESGRLLVGLGPKDSEPDFTNYHPPVLPILGVDVSSFSAGKSVVVDAKATTFPTNGLRNLKPGEYSVQAVFATNRDINLPLAPGNACSETRNIRIDANGPNRIELLLDRRCEDEIPPESATHKYLSIRSKLLSDFYGRPMDYRVGVVLPESFDQNTNKKFGLLVHIGGFGTRYTNAAHIEPDPRFVQILTDGAGPFGDPYQVDSANNGPYGEALTTEVIPFVEKSFRCYGTPKTRFTAGASTGGWVSLALQVFYPDFFNGCWSQCPDSVTFERYELIDLYGDENAYVNSFGVERPSTRNLDGDTISSVRHEVLLESTLGLGSQWQLSGRDWASWNAVYGPKGQNGLPVPVWNGETGEIDKSIFEHWKKYDLMHRLQDNWRVLGPKLAGGKIHIWVGDSDDYFLNAAVRRLADAVKNLEQPKFDGVILIEARMGHDAGGWTRQEMLDAMAARMK